MALGKQEMESDRIWDHPPGVHRLIHVCFFLSGMAALTYQISWMKALGLVFGRTTYAITAVLAAFMAGLALGSWLLGRYAERARNPLRLYGWMELGIGLSGLASLAGIWAIREFYPQVYTLLADSPLLVLTYRFLASFLVLLIPTTLMGGTYPLVVKFLTRRAQQLGRVASRLYWLNTAGAITGTCLAGFVLLWRVGLLRSVLCAAGANLLVAAMVLLSPASRGSAVEAAGRTRPEEEVQPAPRGAWLILLVSAVSGFVSMMFEISWTRILAIFLSSTTYAFTLMLATFLFGIALGSFLFERWHRRWTLSHRLLGQLLTLLALSGLGFLALGTEWAELTRWLARAAGESAAGLLVAQFLASFLAMILPTTLFGLIFPLTVVLYCGEDERRGARSGLLYAVNTLGAIGGAVLTGLVLIQQVNTVTTSLLGSALIAAVASWVFVKSEQKLGARRALLSSGVVALALVGVGTGMFANPILYGRSVIGSINRPGLWNPLTLDEIVGMDKIVFAEEGVNATVVVARREGYVSIRTDGKTEASSGGDVETQLLLAYLPLSFHPQPRRVLVVGFGSGASVHAATQFSTVERVDCIEIEPAVLRAAPHLETLNHGVYQHPKVRLILDDARNYLRVSREKYDVIISEPSFLWSSGVSALFTQEFYKQVKEHLGPDGLFVQWVQAYQIGVRDVATVARTLGSTFDHVSMWRGSINDFLLLSSPTVRPLRLDRLETEFARAPSLRQWLATGLSVGEPGGLLGYFLLDDSSLRTLARMGDLNTDDRTVLEYRTPYYLSQTTEVLNHSIVRSLRRSSLPDSVDLTDSQTAVLAGAETQVRNGMLNHALGAPLLPEAIQTPESERTLLLRASLAFQQGRVLDAWDSLKRAQLLAPNNPRVLYNLAQFHLSQGKDAEARGLLERFLDLSLEDVDRLRLGALRALVELELRSRRVLRAIEIQERVIEANPESLYAEWARLGELLLLSGRTVEALQAFKESLELEPLGFSAHRNLAELLMGANQREQALVEYRFLVKNYPDRDPVIYLRMAEAYEGIGRAGAAKQALGKARRIFPSDARVERALWALSEN